jgi:hypothetical protein
LQKPVVFPVGFPVGFPAGFLVVFWWFFGAVLSVFIFEDLKETNNEVCSLVTMSESITLLSL